MLKLTRLVHFGRNSRTSQWEFFASSSIDKKPDTTVESTVTTAGETVPGTVVGVLNEDLSTGTVVTLPQSPISIELEAAKSLLALKNEGDTTNQDNNQQALNSSLPPTSPAHLVTKDSNPTPPPPEVTVNKTKMPNKACENLLKTVLKENNVTQNVETQAVGTAAVETSSENNPADTSTPGGVIILPLPSCPVTPLNIHPENKKVETGTETPTSQSDTHTDKTDQVETTKTNHVEMTTTTKNSELKTNTVLNKCTVKLTKLSREDVKQLCRPKPISKSNPTTEPAADVETHYRTRSSMRPKTKRKNRLPHSVSSNVSYEQEGNLSSKDDKSPVSKKCIKLCPKREPSSA